MKKTLLTLLIALLFCVSCSQQTSTPVAKPAAPEAPKGPVLIKVGDTSITEESVRMEMEMLPPDVQEMLLDKKGMEDFIDEVVKKEVLYQEARKQKLDENATYKKRMEEIQKRLLIELLIEKSIQEVKEQEITDAKAREFYDQNKEQFVAEMPGGKKQVIEFEAVKDMLKERMREQSGVLAQREAFERFVDGVMKNYKVERDQAAIDKLITTAKPKAPVVAPVQPDTTPAAPAEPKK